MAVRLRMRRMGRRNRAFFRLAAVDPRSPRDGRVLEELGHYDPLVRGTDGLKLNRTRVEYWLSQGAKPSGTVAALLKKCGIAAAAGA